jgi:hypothetical protein
VSVIDTIISNLDIVDYVSKYTRLHRSGSTYRGICPLHNGDNQSSLTIFNDNSFYCWSCGANGNIINFAALANNISYGEAIEMLAMEANIDLSSDEEYVKEKTQYEKNQRAAQQYYNKVSIIREYLHDERGLNDETIDSFFLGYDNSRGKAIVIPLHDKNGRIVAFCKRYLDRTPKYVNSKNNELYEKGEYLFNEYQAKRQLQNYQRLYVCEGYIDAMSAYQQGCACVAYCGSELTKSQILEIRQMVLHTPNVVIMYAPDNDDTGQSKIQRTWEKFNEFAPKLDVRCVRFPENKKDFNEVLTSGGNIYELPSEPIALTAIKQALNSCMDKQAEFGVAIEKIKAVRNPLTKGEIIEYLAKRWDKPINDVKEITSIDYLDDEVVADFKDVDSCFSDYLTLINTEGNGIGFPTLDEAIRLRPTDVVFWAGYSGTFKTMVACEVALYNAVRLKKNVLFFSLEMSAGSLYERLISRIMGCSSAKVQEMAQDGQQAVLLQKVKERLQERIWVVDKSNLTMKDIERYVTIANTRVIKDGKVDMIILDYFQYLNMNTFEEIAEAAKYTKTIAKNNDLVFFILSQLNRTGDNYLRPTLKMLKGSGDLEATGDYVVLAWRPEFDPKLTVQEQDEMRGHLSLYLGKARRGSRANEFELLYNPEKSRLEDLGVTDNES